MFTALEHEVVPETLQPFFSHAFLSSPVSFPDGEGHCSHELPLPQRNKSCEELYPGRRAFMRVFPISPRNISHRIHPVHIARTYILAGYSIHIVKDTSAANVERRKRRDPAMIFFIRIGVVIFLNLVLPSIIPQTAAGITVNGRIMDRILAVVSSSWWSSGSFMSMAVDMMMRKGIKTARAWGKCTAMG